MSYQDPSYAAWAVQNPTTPADALAAIAQNHPALRDGVVTHPNAYPQLVAWIAAQSTSAASTPAPAHSGAPAYGPAAPQQYAPQPQGPGPGQYQPGPQQYPPHAGYGQPVKKKTGLVLGLVGGAVVVVGVVAVLGFVVFGWFGSGSGGTLDATQVERFLDSEFMQKASDGTNLSDYKHGTFTRADLGRQAGLPQCQDAVDMLVGTQTWEASWVSVGLLPKPTTPKAYYDAVSRCKDEESTISVHSQDGGWWVTDETTTVLFVYANVWLFVNDVTDTSDDELKDLFGQFRAAVKAAK